MPDAPTRTTLTAQGVEIERVVNRFQNGLCAQFRTEESDCCCAWIWAENNSSSVTVESGDFEVDQARIVAIAIGLAIEWIALEQAKVKGRANA